MSDHRQGVLRRARRWAVPFSLLYGIFGTILLPGCGGQQVASPPALFLPPAAASLSPPSTSLPAGQFSFLAPSTPTTVAPPSGVLCRNDLQYLEDLTIPDGSLVAPGSLLDKQWRVKNSGDCDWDGHYRLRLVSGDALGAATEQALYPARAGTEAVLRILFTAPLVAGTYRSEWQAYAPDNTPFGEPVFIEVVVSP